MKKLTIVFILLVVSFSLFAKKTEIIVIGTVHQPTNNYSVADLVDIFEKINPDLILIEWPISWDGKYTFKDITRPDNKISLEDSTVQKYMSDNKNVLLHYYDIADRNKYYQESDYYKKYPEFNNKLQQLSKDKELSPRSQLLYNIIKSFDDVLMNYALVGTPRGVNTETTDYLIDMIYQYNNKIPEIISETKELNKYQNLYNEKMKFWDKRNHAMTDNILNYSKQFQGKKIIVLCGFEHRYYLRKLLKEAENKNDIILKEYWEY